MAKDPSTAPEAPTPPETPEHVCHVLLTPAQRDVVREKTGREMMFVGIADDDHEFEEGMPGRTPDDIQWYAIQEAEALNEYEVEYHAYLVALAAWQDAEEDEESAKVEALEEKSEEEVAKLQGDIEAFHAEEEKAYEGAKEEAKKAWDPKGKKQKKLDKQRAAQE